MTKLPDTSRKHYRELVDKFNSISEHMNELRLRETAESLGALLKASFDELDTVDRLLVAARARLRCENSSNPCNTDCRVIGAPPCCENCRVHRQISEYFQP